ncbi:hypothetical protein V8C86DRAFT_3127644 [Haematococcus lacustris]
MQMNVSRFSTQQLRAATHQYELVLPWAALPSSANEKQGQNAVACRITPNPVPGSAFPSLTHLSLDYRHMGVGGDDSWSPSVHPEFLVPPAQYTFSFALLPCHVTRANREQAASHPGLGGGLD